MMHSVKYYETLSIAKAALFGLCLLMMGSCQRVEDQVGALKPADLSTPETALESVVALLKDQRCARVHTLCTDAGRRSLANSCSIQYILQPGDFRATENYHELGELLSSAAVIRVGMAEDRVQFQIPGDDPVCVEFVQVASEWRLDYCDWNSVL